MTEQAALKIIGTDYDVVWSKGLGEAGLLDTPPFVDLFRMLDTAAERCPLSVVIGEAGLGKTTACNFFSEWRREKGDGALNCVYWLPPPRDTYNDAFYVVRDFGLHLGILDITREGIMAGIAKRCEQGLFVMVDEAEELPTMMLTVIRRLSDQTPSRFCLLGVPRLRDLVVKYEEFSSRISLYYHLERLGKDYFEGRLFKDFPPLAREEAYHHTQGCIRRLRWLVEAARRFISATAVEAKLHGVYEVGDSNINHDTVTKEVMRRLRSGRNGQRSGARHSREREPAERAA